MKKKFVILAAVLLAVILPFASFAGGETPAKASSTPLSFSTQTLYGKPFSSSCFSKYDLVIVNYWAEWCGPCVGELPDLQKIHENFKNILLIGAYVDDNNSAAIAMAESKGVTYPLISAMELPGIYDYLTFSSGGGFSIPQTCFFKNTGKQIGKAYIGSRDYESWVAVIEYVSGITPGSSDDPAPSDPPADDPTPPPDDDPETVSAVIKGLEYTLDNNTLTATLTGAEKKNLKKLTVPAAVSYKGRKYKVTAIGKSAFAKYKSLTSLVIGKNVSDIGINAFNGCKSLKRITIKTVRLVNGSVGKKAFRSISKKAVVKCPSGMAESYKAILVSAGAPKTIQCK